MSLFWSRKQEVKLQIILQIIKWSESDNECQNLCLGDALIYDPNSCPVSGERWTTDGCELSARGQAAKDRLEWMESAFP